MIMSRKDPRGWFPSWRKFVLAFLGFVLILASLVLYLQTQHAFKHVIVPFIEKTVPGHFDAEQGSLTFPGMIQLAGLSYDDPDSGLTVRINRLFLRVSAFALLKDRELLVEDLAIEHGDVRIATEPARTRQDSQVTQPSGKMTVLALPLAIQRVQVNDVTVSIRTERNAFTAENMTLAAGEIGPGRSGTVELSGNISLDDLTDQTRWAGGLILKGKIEQSPDRYQLKWEGTNEAELREWPLRDATARSEPVTIHHSLAGSYDVSEARLRHTSSLTVRHGTTALGALSLAVTRTEQPAGPVMMDAGLVVQELSADALNLMLRHKEPTRLRSEHLGGHANIHADGDRYTIASSITGRRLQIVSGANETPPLDIDVVQGGSADLHSKILAIERFQVRVAENGQLRLTGELDGPLTLRAGTETLESEPSPDQTASDGGGTVTINNFGVPELRSWLQVFGMSGWQGIRRGQFNGTVTVLSRGKGQRLDLHAALKISDVLMDDPERSRALGPVTFANEFHGTVVNLSRLELTSWTATIADRSRIKGTLRLSGTLNLKEPATNPLLKASLSLTELPGETLNPWLTRWTDARIARALFTGTADVEMTGELVKWQIDLDGRRIAVWLPDSTRPTSPLDVRLAQTGHIDRTAAILHLDKATVNALDRSRPVMTAVLDKPIRFPLPGSGRDQSSPRMDTQPADFRLEANRLGIDLIRSQLSLVGLTALDRVKSGLVDARLTIHWKGLSEPASVAGSLDVADLRLDAGAMRIREPLRLRTRIDATVTEFTSVQLKNVNLRALAGSNLLAETGLTGSANLKDTSLNLALSFAAGDMPAVLAKLGLLDERQLKLFTRGKVEADGRVTSQGQNLPLSLRATIRARDLRFQPLPGQFFTYALLAKSEMEVNPARTTVEFKPLDLTLEAIGKETGTLNIRGTWPIASAVSGGSIHIIATNLDLGPMAELSGLLPGRLPGPLPVNGDVTVALEPPAGSLTLRGQESIGPVRVVRQDGGPSTATLRIKHDLTRGNDSIQLSSLSLMADRPPGVPDSVTLNGQVRFAGKQSGHVKGNVASLDAGWYAALVTAPQSSTPSENRQRTVTKPADRQNQSKAPAVLLGLDAELAIGSVSYGKLLVGPGRLTSEGTGGQRHVKLEPTGFAGGQIDGILNIDSNKTPPKLTWAAKGRGLEVGTILAAVKPDREPRFNGTGTFETSGSGVLEAGPLRNHLKGTADFKITDGQFFQPPALHFLAEYTKIQDLDVMKFDDFHGHVQLDAGAIRIDPLAARGSAALLDSTATITADNTIDGQIFVKLGPSLAKQISIPCMSALLAAPDGFTTLPFALQIKGPVEKPAYTVQAAAWDYTKGTVGALTDTMKNLMRGCREESSQNRSK